MTITDAARQTKNTGTAHLVRYRTDSVKQTGTAQYDVKEYGSGSKKGWCLLDIFTAGAICACYDALNEGNREKFNNIPLMRLAEFCFKHVR